MRYFSIQTAPIVDGFDETETYSKRPYPIVVDENGNVTSYGYDRVLGFVADLARQAIDITWRDFAGTDFDPTLVQGMYVIVSDAERQWSTISTAIESMKEVA